MRYIRRRRSRAASSREFENRSVDTSRTAINRGWKVDIVKRRESIRRTAARNILATLFATAILTVIPSSGRAQDGAQSIDAPIGSDRLRALVDEALARSPVVLAARSHWQAQTKVPIQPSTLPDPQVSLQHFTVGSPQAFSRYENSTFYYTAFALSQAL